MANKTVVSIHAISLLIPGSFTFETNGQWWIDYSEMEKNEMANKAETAIVQSILHWVKSVGGDGFHVHGSAIQRAGEPDIDCALPNQNIKPSGWMHIKCEVKVPGETPTPLQQHRLEEYRKRGYKAFWVTSLKEFQRAVGFETD